MWYTITGNSDHFLRGNTLAPKTAILTRSRTHVVTRHTVSIFVPALQGYAWLYSHLVPSLALPQIPRFHHFSGSAKRAFPRIDCPVGCYSITGNSNHFLQGKTFAPKTTVLTRGCAQVLNQHTPSIFVLALQWRTWLFSNFVGSLYSLVVFPRSRWCRWLAG